MLSEETLGLVVFAYWLMTVIIHMTGLGTAVILKA